MVYNPDKHHRESIRLKGYDYSRPGFYYVTLCTQDRENRFGVIVNDEMLLNSAGAMIKVELERIQKRYSNIILDTYQIMPNHLHGIMQIISMDNNRSVGTGLVPVQNILDESVDIGCIDDDKTNVKRAGDEIVVSDGMGTRSKRTGTRPVPTTLFDVIGTFKSITQKNYSFHVLNNEWPPFRKRLWQLRFHDHIIRSQDELDRSRRYIIDNPKNWMQDENHL
ncbi:MAG: hypothetical protein HGB06_04195 [Chlorobaculum sp.]|jgi:REP element-mobilizing transposase RayT|nr:hypothetical protein [Chlorobaculum sp.]